MALQKEIELVNGIVVRYHRIVSINKITNKNIIIEVASYISKSKRDDELERIEQGEPMDIFINTNYINKEYNENDTIQDIYTYLKTTSMFKDAEDI